MLLATALATSAVGCAHCDTCDDFPAPYNGPPMMYGYNGMTMNAPADANATTTPPATTDGTQAPADGATAPPSTDGTTTSPFNNTPNMPQTNPSAGTPSAAPDSPPAAPGGATAPPQ
jgi:hypothetical protein